MSKDDKSQKPAAAQAVVPPPESDPFGDIEWGENLSEPDIDGWHDPEITPLVQGKIVGFKVIDTDNGLSDVVIIKLMKPVSAKGNKGEPVELKMGQMLGVFVRSKLVPLLDYVEHKCVVRFRTLEKVSIKGGKTMWTFDINAAKGSRVGAAPKNSVMAAQFSLPVTSKGRGKQSDGWDFP